MPDMPTSPAPSTPATPPSTPPPPSSPVPRSSPKASEGGSSAHGLILTILIILVVLSLAGTAFAYYLSSANVKAVRDETAMVRQDVTALADQVSMAADKLVEIQTAMEEEKAMEAKSMIETQVIRLPVGGSETVTLRKGQTVNITHEGDQESVTLIDVVGGTGTVLVRFHDGSTVRSVEEGILLDTALTTMMGVEVNEADGTIIITISDQLAGE